MLLLAAVLMFSLAAPAVADDANRTLNVSLSADIETYDVHQTTADYEVPLNIFDRLFELVPVNGDIQLVNSLCKDYTISDDGLVFSFTLRDDVYFSDGNKLTADDVAYTFTRMVALENSEQEYLFESMLGYDEFDYSGNYHDAVIPGIEVTGEDSFVITLTKPYAGFLNILASPACSIYEKAVVEAAGDSFGNDMAYCIGSGAYTMDQWVRDGKIVLGYNELYWNEAPDFKNVIISIIPDANTLDMLYQAGEIDILDCDELDTAIVAATYKTIYADKIVVSNRLGTTYMSLNALTGPFADIAVRKAVQMAVDRDTIIATILNGDAQTIDGIYPVGLVGFATENQGWLKYDPEGAIALLEGAGYTKDANGYYTTFTFINDESNSATRQLVIQVIQQQLQKVGINAVIENVDHSTYLARRRAGEIDSYVSTWTADYNDPDNFIATFFGSVSATTSRSIGYQNEEIIKRVCDAPAIVDETERLAEYAELERITIMDDASWVPLYQQTHLFAISDKVDVFVPHWAGYSDCQFIYVTAK